MGVAQVAVEAAVFYFDKLFSYRIPSGPLEKVSRGCRVLVPFGRGNRLCEGLVFSVSAEESGEGLKELEAVLDEEPVLNEEGFRIVEYMAETVFCSYYDAVKCLLPAGLSVDAFQHYLLERK